MYSDRRPTDPTRRTISARALAILILGAALFALPACGGGGEESAANGGGGETSTDPGTDPGSDKPRLLYYAPADCAECDTAAAQLEKIAGESGGKVEYQRRDGTSAQGQKERQRYGLNALEGIVLLGQEGWPRWVAKGHDLDEAKVREQVQAVLSAKPGEPEGYGK